MEDKADRAARDRERKRQSSARDRAVQETEQQETEVG